MEWLGHGPELLGVPLHNLLDVMRLSQSFGVMSGQPLHDMGTGTFQVVVGWPGRHPPATLQGISELLTAAAPE